MLFIEAAAVLAWMTSLSTYTQCAHLGRGGSRLRTRFLVKQCITFIMTCDLAFARSWNSRGREEFERVVQTSAEGHSKRTLRAVVHQ